MGRFDGRVALITGAASGIGRATCIRLASEGAQIFGSDISSTGLAETEAALKEAGCAVRTGVFNVAERSSCFDCVEAAVEAFGRLDVLANVAGIVRFAHAHEMPEEEWRLIMSINLDGPFFMSQAAIPHLLETGGNIVNVASNAGIMGQAYTAAYCVSKGGLIQLTRSLAMEYMKRGIRVNAVAPGGTKTPLAAGIQMPDELDLELMKRYMGMRGLGEADDVAGLIAYLASDDARSVHGACFSIDNGITAG